MIRTRDLAVAVAALLLVACAPVAPAAAPALAAAPGALPAAVATDTMARPALRPLPVPAVHRAAIERGTRTETGAPGPRYWQQSLRYRIDAELDPQTTTLRGTARIDYRNNSPDTLRSMVLNLYQNVFAEGVVRNRHVTVTGGTTLERVVADGQELRRLSPREVAITVEPARGAPTGYAVQGTLGRLVLPRPLAPGDSTLVEVQWHQRVPPAGTFRTAWEDALGGRAFQVAQWYPQIAVYDDLRGWNATPYLGDGEFYLEYADFEVSLRLPAGWLVTATGELRNADELLTPEAQRRLADALRSDTVTRVVTEADLRAGNTTRPARDGRLTWRFRADSVRDFAFATSDRYVWDATRAAVPAEAGGTRSVAVHAFYRRGAPHWEQAARFTQHATEFLSRRLIPYLYPQITMAEGSVGGMEYPMVNFIGKFQQPTSLYGVIAHEAAHQWFPMMVSTDEAAYAWLDEGAASFYETLASADFFATPPAFATDREAYLRVAGTQAEVPMMRHTDLVSPFGARVVAAYRKPATLFRALRAVVGEESFDRAIDTFASEWLFKHASPWDFFHTFERVTGRDLDWFFYPWWFETGVLDHAIEHVEGAQTGTVRVTVRDRGDNPMPTPITATTATGHTVSTVIPVETWLAGARTATVTLQAPGPVVRIEIDPEHVFPDVNRADNVWTR
jgi:hypothetical protein